MDSNDDEVKAGADRYGGDGDGREDNMSAAKAALGSHTPHDDELQEEEQDMVQTEEEAKFSLIDNQICGDLFNRLNAFQLHA